MTSMILTNSNGRPVVVDRLLGKGGEASVFSVMEHPSDVAKIYHSSDQLRERIAKIRAMLANPPVDPTAGQSHISICWPTALLFNDSKEGIGFLMHKAQGEHVFKLYNPRDRKQLWPAFTWAYLLRTAKHIASVVEAIHAKGYVIGDLNESNIFVTHTAMVTLLDCDSMQVPKSDPKQFFRCLVGKEEYTPPELQGRDFSLIDRVKAHDNFALGVLIFQLLMEGVHPFSGVWHGAGDPPPIAECIAKGATPYIGASIITPRPGALPFGMLPKALQQLFQKCFNPKSPDSRPSAGEWKEILSQTEDALKSCAQNRNHIFGNHLAHCPWCTRAQLLGGDDPFPLVVVPGNAQSVPLSPPMTYVPNFTMGGPSLKTQAVPLNPPVTPSIAYSNWIPKPLVGIRYAIGIITIILLLVGVISGLRSKNNQGQNPQVTDPAPSAETKQNTEQISLPLESATEDAPTQVSIPTVHAISSAYAHTCALHADGTIRCWGDNRYGQLGDGTMIDASTLVAVIGIGTATAISAGGDHTCALHADGTIRCWGHNFSGQLGDGTTTNSSTPVTVGGIGTATAISAGASHTCALLADSTIRCWGHNLFGGLGNGTTTNSSTPVTVVGISTATAISAGGHTCALLADGTIRCWGHNMNGQLGNGTNTDSSTPVAVAGISTATAILAGLSHTCALLADGTIRCWGKNGNGQIGNGTRISSSTPVAVVGISTATAISGGRDHIIGGYTGNRTCALLADGTIRCWGGNDDGQLGNGTKIDSSTPVAVAGISTATAISVGGGHTCALLADGTIRCWGDNDDSQLGDGTKTNSSTPVAVVGITPTARDHNELSIEQSWQGNGFELRLDRVKVDPEVGPNEVNTKFYVTNLENDEIKFMVGPNEGYFALIDNKGRKWPPISMLSGEVKVSGGQRSDDIGPRFDGSLLSDPEVTELSLVVQGLLGVQQIAWKIPINQKPVPSSTDTLLGTELAEGKEWHYGGRIFRLDRVKPIKDAIMTEFYVTNKTTAPFVFNPNFEQGYFELRDNKNRVWPANGGTTDLIALDPDETTGNIGPIFDGLPITDLQGTQLTIVVKGLLDVPEAKWVFRVNSSPTDPPKSDTPVGPSAEGTDKSISASTPTPLQPEDTRAFPKVSIWQGTVHQPGVNPYPVISVSYKGSSNIDYPTLQCGGLLQPKEEKEDFAEFAEEIHYGKCITGGTVRMKKNADGSATWNWYYPDGRHRAEAILHIRH